MPVRSNAPRDAIAPSSMAEMSLSAPTYSVIGVRAPPTMKTSGLVMISASPLHAWLEGADRLFGARLDRAHLGRDANRVGRRQFCARLDFFAASRLFAFLL